jgi:hypothetical protein
MWPFNAFIGTRHFLQVIVYPQPAPPADGGSPFRNANTGRSTLKKEEAIVTDGREEREERKKRIEQEKPQDREDRVDREDPEEWAPERVDS